MGVGERESLQPNAADLAVGQDSSGRQAATALAESRPSWSPSGGGGSCLFVLLFGLFVSFVPSTDFASFPDLRANGRALWIFLKETGLASVLVLAVSQS